MAPEDETMEVASEDVGSVAKIIGDAVVEGAEAAAAEAEAPPEPTAEDKARVAVGNLGGARIAARRAVAAGDGAAAKSAVAAAKSAADELEAVADELAPPGDE